MNRKITLAGLLPVLFSFFVMGFVDVVGVATSYVKADFALNDRLANLLPMMVFLWFAVCSLPAGVLMGRIGRRRTVMASGAVTFAAMLLPLLHYSFPVVLTAFALLGIGNTMLQVSLNPLLADAAGEARTASLLTLGQFIKALCSMLGPVLVGAAAGVWGDWRLIFPLYAAVTLLSWIWMARLKLDESRSEPVSARGVGRLLSDARMLVLLSVIVLSVGFEIGLMTAVPKYLAERCSLSLERAAMGCSVYYMARTAGTFLGAVILSRISPRRFMTATMALALASLGLFMTAAHATVLLAALFVLGICCANVFAIAFAAALRSAPGRADEVSALMIMGVAGGALLPPVMGLVADAAGQWGSLLVPGAALLYLFAASFKLKD